VLLNVAVADHDSDVVVDVRFLAVLLVFDVNAAVVVDVSGGC